MAISWYPGHMHKASKELRKILPGTRLLVEVLDARMPLASGNPKLAEIDPGIARLRVLNKADLADPDTTRAWQQWFQSQPNSRCVISTLNEPLTRQQLIDCTHALQLDAGNKGNGQIVIIGIPNVGKSTLLNHLAGRKLAKTGNEPAVTRGQQRIRLDENWFLVDTPGLMWPRLEDQDGAYKLAMAGTIRNTAIDLADVGWWAMEWFLAHQCGALTERYQLDPEVRDTEQALIQVARQRGALGKGGHVDWHKAAEMLLNDFRSGKLGAISLESPPD